MRFSISDFLFMIAVFSRRSMRGQGHLLLLLPILVLLELCVSGVVSASPQLPQPTALVVRKSGLTAPHPTDTALNLYVILENQGSEILDEIFTQDAHCCLYQPLPDGTNNCIKVNLLGDQAFNLMPGASCLLKLLYPTLYIFDRKGECLVEVAYRSANKPPASTVKHIMSFDTSDIAHFWMPRLAKVWLLGYEDCDSVDHDRQRACHPVDCALKYEGQRNFYNASSKRCEPLTLCMSDDNQPLPTMAYQRRLNSCKSLEVNLTEEDVTFLEGDKPTATYDQHNPMTIYQYVCLHGQSREDHSGCVCDAGWRTSEKDYTLTNPDTDLIHMCDTPANLGLGHMINIKSKPTQIALIVLGSLCGALLTVVAALSFFTWWKTQALVNDLNIQDFEKRPLYPATISMTHLSAENSRSSLHKVSQASLSSLKESWRYESARVHTPNMPLTNSELDLRVGDVITYLEETSVLGMWKGECKGVRGSFPVCCAELYRHGQGPKPTD